MAAILSLDYLFAKEKDVSLPAPYRVLPLFRRWILRDVRQPHPAGVVGRKTPDGSVIAQGKEPGRGCADLDDASHGSTTTPLFPKRLANVGNHYTHLFDCLLELLRSYSKLFCPISEFVIFVDIDPVAVPVIAFRCVVGHSACSSPFGMTTDSKHLKGMCSAEQYFAHDATRTSKPGG
jgi:hypothetical protein